MTLEERRQYLTQMLERHKARGFDLRTQLDQVEDQVNALLGAMETVNDMITAEKKTNDG